MKICALSDLHGTLLPVSEFSPCNVVFICGDISPLNIQANDKKMKKWLSETFKPWCEALPCNKVFFIAGNHDWICFRNPDFMFSVFLPDDKVTYLCHSRASFTTEDGKEYSIFGTPYCKLFGNWAFMKSDSELTRLYSEIPENLDILMTHDAPYGVSDIILQEDCLWYDGKTHIGNKPLSQEILRKAPKVVLHGHLHSTSRIFEECGYSKVANCSINDEHYNPIYDPLIFEL